MQVLDEAHLLNIAVMSPHQRQGAGRLMLQYVMAHARDAGAARMFLEVRASNKPAQALYLRSGFLSIRRRKAYYEIPDSPAQREDAIVMAIDLTENAIHG